MKRNPSPAKDEKRPATEAKAPASDKKRPATAVAGKATSARPGAMDHREPTPANSCPTPRPWRPIKIVILGRNAEVFLTDDALAKLRKWLTEGEGSLVCFRGPPASQIGQRLGELMPVRWTPAAEIAITRAIDRRRPGVALAAGRGRRRRSTGRAALAGHHGRPEAAKALAVVLATGVAGGSGRASPGDRLSAGGQRPGGRRGRGRHVALGLSRARTSEARGNLRLAVAEPGPLAGGQRGLVALAAAGPARRQAQLQHRRKRHGHAVGPRLVGRAAAGGARRGGSLDAAAGASPACRSGNYPGPVLRRPGPAAGRAILAPRARARQERSVGRGGLRRPRKPGRAARRLRASRT